MFGGFRAIRAVERRRAVEAQRRLVRRVVCEELHLAVLVIAGESAATSYALSSLAKEQDRERVEQGR